MATVTAQDRELLATAAELMNDYFFGLDARAFEAAVECFTESVQCSYGGLELPRGRGAVLDYLQAALSGVRSTRHLATSAGLINRDGGGVQVLTHAIAYVMSDGEGATARGQIRGISYEDDLVRTDSGWRIAVRRHTVDWSIGVAPEFVAAGHDELVRSGLPASGEGAGDE